VPVACPLAACRLRAPRKAGAGILCRMILYLIRHAETEANAGRVIQHPETPLSARGRAQARRLAARLRGEGIERVLASDYARAAGTAQAICAASGASLVPEPLLRERNLGALRGRSYAELGFDPFAADYAPPDGETWEAFHQRVGAAWEAMKRAASAAAGPVAVVTHGLVCHSLVTRRVQLPPGSGLEAPERTRWANTGLTVLEGPEPYRVRLLNCTAHLQGDGEKRPEDPAGQLGS